MKNMSTRTTIVFAASDTRRSSDYSGVVFEERQPGLLPGKHSTAHRDPQHGLHPRVFTHALMDHVVQRASRTRLRTKEHPRVGNLRPHAERLQSFGSIAVDEEFVPSHVEACRRTYLISWR